MAFNDAIKVKVKDVYGKTTIYPANEAAETLAAIAGTKTLTPATLELAEKLGLLVMEVGTTYTKYAVYPG